VRTSITGFLSEDTYDVFQVPVHDKVVTGAAVVTFAVTFAAASAVTTIVVSAAGADGVAVSVAAAVVAAVVVAGAVPEELVQPAAIIMMQARPARRITSDFLIKIFQMSVGPCK
jgi:hypothetical protein